MKDTDVKTLGEIPMLKELITECFEFNMYEKGDNFQFYNLTLDNGDEVDIHFVSEEPLIENGIPLVSILTQEGLCFFEWTYKPSELDKDYKTYSWRPLVNGFFKEELI
jgi:hypothetical protein